MTQRTTSARRRTTLALLAFMLLHHESSLAQVDASETENQPTDRLICNIEGSADSFELYPEQVSFRSEQFVHYQLIKGLTVIVVHRPSLRFNRIGNLNLLPYSTLDQTRPAEPIQILGGTCKPLR